MLGPSRNMIPTAMAKIWLILIILLPLLGIFVNYLLRVGGTAPHSHIHTHTAHKICFMHSIKMVCGSAFGLRPVWAAAVLIEFSGTLYAFYGLAMNVTLMSS